MAVLNRRHDMQTEMQLQPAEAGQAIISLSVPADKANMVADAIRSVLTLAGHEVRRINPDGEEVVSSAEVFPDASPAMALRGFRGKMEWTQQELAEKLGTTQNCISDMESGKRLISMNMAKRLEKIFNIPYKVFL